MYESVPRSIVYVWESGRPLSFYPERNTPPVWVQRLGLTWLVRLCQEPRRLAKRNLYSPVFAAMFLRQLILGHKRKQDRPQRLAAQAPGQRSPE